MIEPFSFFVGWIAGVVVFNILLYFIQRPPA
jgi:hypothetical protein